MEYPVSNKTFADALVLEHQSRIYAEERQAIEKRLGEGAIKYKMDRAGMRTLFAALDQEKRAKTRKMQS